MRLNSLGMFPCIYMLEDCQLMVVPLLSLLITETPITPRPSLRRLAKRFLVAQLIEMSIPFRHALNHVCFPQLDVRR